MIVQQSTVNTTSSIITFMDMNHSTRLTTWTQRTNAKSILIISLITGGGFLPCLLLIFCLYIFCQHDMDVVDDDDNDDDNHHHHRRRLSLSDSTSDEGSTTANKWRIGSF
jgi:hypothetical protein